MHEPRFAAKERDHSDDEINDLVRAVMEKAIRFLENCEKDRLTLKQAIKLYKKEYRMFKDLG